MGVEFSILNESSLHNTLKNYYAIQFEGQTEVKEDGHIYDIVTKHNEIIEIQTKNLSKLHNKIKDILSKNKKIRLVYPLVNTKTILLTDKNGKLISKRKSPQKGSIYDIFKEITGLTDILLNENFKLEIIEINLVEHRIKTEEKQIHPRGRFPKDYIKVNKHLEEIIRTYTFTSKTDYIKLLPSDLPENFKSADLKLSLKRTKTQSRIINNCNIILWVLRKMELISIIKKEGNSYIYKIN